MAAGFGFGHGDRELLQAALNVQPHGDTVAQFVAEIGDAVIVAQIAKRFEGTNFPIVSPDTLVGPLAELLGGADPADVASVLSGLIPSGFFPIVSTDDLLPKSLFVLQAHHLINPERFRCK